MKPLNKKAYGHIPHFIGSRMTPTDKHCHSGQQDIMTKKPRDRKDLIIVQEKLDGSCCAVAKINGEIIALTRAGYVASSSPYRQHHYFDMWVRDSINQARFDYMLNEGERVAGEWIIQAHGTRYEIQDDQIFIPFDIMIDSDRLVYHDFLLRVLPLCFAVPRLIHIGQPYPLEKAKKAISVSGHNAIDPVEGFVYRCERIDKVDFLIKWVRPDKIDGLYLGGDQEVWNISPDQIR